MVDCASCRGWQGVGVKEALVVLDVVLTVLKLLIEFFYLQRSIYHPLRGYLSLLEEKLSSVDLMIKSLFCIVSIRRLLRYQGASHLHLKYTQVFDPLIYIFKQLQTAFNVVLIRLHILNVLNKCNVRLSVNKLL